MPEDEVTDPEHTAGRMLSQRMRPGINAKRSAYLMAEAHWRGAVEHKDTASVLFWARVKEILK